jgi:hypothetical protein
MFAEREDGPRLGGPTLGGPTLGPGASLSRAQLIALDVFALGATFFFVLAGGEHAFGRCVGGSNERRDDPDDRDFAFEAEALGAVEAARTRAERAAAAAIERHRPPRWPLLERGLARLGVGRGDPRGEAVHRILSRMLSHLWWERPTMEEILRSAACGAGQG